MYILPAAAGCEAKGEDEGRRWGVYCGEGMIDEPTLRGGGVHVSSSLRAGFSSVLPSFPVPSPFDIEGDDGNLGSTGKKANDVAAALVASVLFSLF